MIVVSLFILIISLFSVFGEETTDEEPILVPIEELEAEQELLDEVEEIPEEVDETVEDIPEEPKEDLEVELISAKEEETAEEVEEAEELPEEETEPKPSLISRGTAKARSLAGAGINKARGIAGWFITRDYVSAAKNFGRFLIGLKLWIKILMIFIGLISLLIIWSYFFKDTRANNLRRARKLHRKGELAHNRRKEDKAEKLYARAAEYREKAQDQW